jgi:hypothetical protein
MDFLRPAVVSTVGLYSVVLAKLFGIGHYESVWEPRCCLLAGRSWIFSTGTGQGTVRHLHTVSPTCLMALPGEGRRRPPRDSHSENIFED